MNGSKELDNIKGKIFGRLPKERDKIFRLCEIINYCGGYVTFLETPLPIILEINKMMDLIAEKQSKSIPKMKSFPRVPRRR